MRKKFYVVLILMCFLAIGLVAGCGSNAAPPSSADTTPPAPVETVIPETDTGNHAVSLWVRKVDLMPEINGKPDKPEWKNAYGIAGDETSIKAIYTDDEIAFLFTLNEPTMNIVSPDSWYLDGDEFVQWREYRIKQGDPIKKAHDFYKMLNVAWETSEFGLDGGCNYMCHADDDYDGGKKHHVVPEGAGADLWNILSKHGYGPGSMYVTGFPLGQLGATQEGTPSFLEDQNNPFQVTTGTYSFIGWVDERIQTSRNNPDYLGTAENTETGKYCLQCHGTKFVENHPLQGKPGKMPYRNNAVGYENMSATAPEYIKLDPKNFADAAIITDKDIEEGRAAKIADLSKDQIRKAWAKYEKLNCLIPALILQEATENMAQILYGAQWSDGAWTVEMKRKRVTEYPDDIQFGDLNKEYFFSSAYGGFGSNGIRVIFDQ